MWVPIGALIGSVIAATATCVWISAVADLIPARSDPSDPIAAVAFADRADLGDLTLPILPADDVGPVPDPPLAPPQPPRITWHAWNLCRGCGPSRHEPGEYGEPETHDYELEPGEGGAPWRVTFAPWALP